VEIQYKKIQSNQTHGLRQRILRPHQTIEEMEYPLDNEQGSYHIGAFIEDQLVGIASLYPESQNTELHRGHWRIRGMAVDEEWQGKGVGRTLVQKCIDYVKGQGGHSLWCHARTSAIGFYDSLGFKRIGNEFEIESIGPHYMAQLELNKSG
jgi:GNAT superfamily N-acetyltransferase